MNAPALIDSQTRDLTAAAEECSLADPLSERCSEALNSLVSHLRGACARPEIRRRYEEYRDADGVLAPYPIDSEGFAESFDPVEQERELFDCWRRSGVVVGKSVLGDRERKNAVERIGEISSSLSGGAFKLDDPDTRGAVPRDAAGVPLLSRGFFEIYHDDSLAQIRQMLRLYLHHVLIWGTAELWTSFDRYGVKLPAHEESKALSLHVDQNPLINAEFKTTQGVAAITDCPEERGTFVAVPGSRGLFREYAMMAGRGEYVPLQPGSALAEKLTPLAQVLPIRGGDAVTWDSRTTHANTENRSSETRIVAYVSAGPVPADAGRLAEVRRAAVESALGSNEREALMHASKKPRFTDPDGVKRVRRPESLTALGKLLYGERSYRDIE